MLASQLWRLLETSAAIWVLQRLDVCYSTRQGYPHGCLTTAQMLPSVQGKVLRGLTLTQAGKGLTVWSGCSQDFLLCHSFQSVRIISLSHCAWISNFLSFYLFCKTLCLGVFQQHECLFTTCMQCPWRPEEGIRFLWTIIGSEGPCGSWDLHLGLLQA